MIEKKKKMREKTLKNLFSVPRVVKTMRHTGVMYVSTVRMLLRFLSFQLLVVHVLFEMPEKRSGARMGAQKLVHRIPPSVLPVVPARGPHPGAAHDRPAVLGRRVRRGEGRRRAGRAAVQHRRARGRRVPGRMGLPDANAARARRHALCRHGLQERRSHKRERPLQGVRHRTAVSAGPVVGKSLLKRAVFESVEYYKREHIAVDIVSVGL